MTNEEECNYFDFDEADREVRQEFNKSLMGAFMTLTAITVVDIKVINMMKHGKSLGPLRKAGILMFLNGPPSFWFFYNSQ
jgi:hypothetical protein